MDYSVFKDREAVLLVRDAFELEAGLEVPDVQLIALVSAQVAAGWYKTPTESTDWISRDNEPDFVDRDFPDDNASARSFYVSGYGLQNTFASGSKTLKSSGRDVPQRESRPSVSKLQATPEPEQLNLNEGSGSEDYRGEKPKHQVLNDTPGKTRSRTESRPYIYKPRATPESEDLDFDEGSGSEIYRAEQLSRQQLDDDSSHIEVQERNRSWPTNYPRQDYSDSELQDIVAKACAPAKPKKLVPMIAGRPNTRMVLAEEYVD